MQKTSMVVLLLIGALLSYAANADDISSAGVDEPRSPLVTLSAESLLEESNYATYWSMLQPDRVSAYSETWAHPIYDIRFQDSSLLARAGRLRGVSFLTLANFGGSRLFLGVNKKGLVGLHFRAYPRYSNEAYLELVRMPYIPLVE